MIAGSTRRSNSNKWREAYSHDPARMQRLRGVLGQSERSTFEPANRANSLEVKKLPVQSNRESRRTRTKSLTPFHTGEENERRPPILF
jgi:hypothetical protein